MNPDISLWEKVANGSPLLVIVVLLGMAALWRHLVARETKWDDERKREHEVRERLVREVVAAVQKNTEAQEKQSDMIEALKEAIEERKPGHR